jgi:hypothetical protein
LVKIVTWTSSTGENGAIGREISFPATRRNSTKKTSVSAWSLLFSELEANVFFVSNDPADVCV